MRMLKTACTACGHGMKVPEHYLEQTVRCESCGGQFTAYAERFAQEVYRSAMNEAREREVAEAAEKERLAAIEELARAEEERVGTLTGIISYIQGDPDRGYNELDVASRKLLESTLATLVEKSEHQRDGLEVTAMRLIAAIPGRMEALTLSHQQRVERTLSNLVSLMSQMAQATTALANQTSSVASKLDVVRQGTTIAGFAAAQTLADRMFGDDSE